MMMESEPQFETIYDSNVNGLVDYFLSQYIQGDTLEIHKPTGVREVSAYSFRRIMQNLEVGDTIEVSYDAMQLNANDGSSLSINFFILQSTSMIFFYKKVIYSNEWASYRFEVNIDDRLTPELSAQGVMLRFDCDNAIDVEDVASIKNITIKKI